MSRSPRIRPPRSIWLYVSLLVTMTAVVPAAYLLSPTILRELRLRQLDDDRPQVRERALNYVIRHAANRLAVFAGAIAKMRDADDGNFVQIMRALDMAGVWRRPLVPADAWLRWLKLVSRDENREGRIVAIQQAAELSELADDRALQLLLHDWLADKDREVRYNALFAVGAMAGTAGDVRPYVHMLGKATADTEPGIAAEAWLLLGTLGKSDIREPDNDQPLEVRNAWLWALSRVDPDAAGERVAALLEDATQPTVLRAFAAGLAMEMPAPVPATRTIIASTPANRLSADNLALLWRCVLAPPAKDEESVAMLRQWAADARPGDDPAVQSVLAAIAWRLADPLDDLYPPLPGADPSTSEQRTPRQVLRQLLQLASIEGGARPHALDPMDSDLLRLLKVWHGEQPRLDDLLPLLRSPASTLRDLGCMAIAHHHDKPALQIRLIEELLTDYDNRGKMSGAVLAGLTRQGVDLLGRRLAAEDDWGVAQVQRLGLWLAGMPVLHAGRSLDMGAAAVNMLGRTDLPRTTVLLALLAKQPGTALDALLQPWAQQALVDAAAINPRAAASDPVDLRALLVDGRWWHVLAPHVPGSLHLWADPDWQQFEIERLRLWHLTHPDRPAPSY